ncbi:hypothetical protein ABIB62_003558 [Mucilaginibacter sp. UYP25]|uniref:hypothetical protein n=1 Tax=unclassified Mucilaginibacter TaxID=2617802 RepID=UPI0033965B98
MNTIDILIAIIKQNFNFMTLRGYSFDTSKVYNENNEARIFAKLEMKNDALNRHLIFTIYPRATTEIEIYITDCSTDLSMNIKHYTEFKKGNVAKPTSDFIVNMNNPSLSVSEISTYLQSLFETDLKDVVYGKQWITFPTYDARDEY